MPARVIPRIRFTPSPRRATLRAGALVALALAVMPTFARAQTYTIASLDDGITYNQTAANGINASGHVTGFGVVAATGEIHALIDRGGVFQDLGLLGYAASDGIAINDTDQLAVDGIGPGSTALSFASGSAHPLGSVDGGFSYVAAINNLGDIAGSALNGDGNRVGFAWLGGVFTDLTSTGLIFARGINDSQTIVGSIGYYWSYGGFVHSVLHAARVAGGVTTDLGNLSGDPRTNTEAYAVNDAGTIVGYSQASDGSEHAFSYSGGAMTDLGTIPGEYAIATAINDSGVVVGNLMNPYGANLSAFVTVNGTLTDLSTLIGSAAADWSALTATAINDAGVIVGTGNFNGGSHGFVAYPVQTLGVGAGLVPAVSRISSIGPNPFRGATAIVFALSARAGAGGARLEVFDVSGRRVATLLDRAASAGPHTIAWDGRGDAGGALPSGVYLARLTTRDGVASRRLVMLQ